MLASEDNAIHWDKTVDFLIVGTGFAGLAGALEAHYQGMKNILVVEKMPTPGGNSIINGGAISAAGTDMQKKLGIEDNPDLMFKDIMHHGGHINHPELARKIADESVANYEWHQERDRSSLFISLLSRRPFRKTESRSGREMRGWIY